MAQAAANDVLFQLNTSSLLRYLSFSYWYIVFPLIDRQDLSILAEDIDIALGRAQTTKGKLSAAWMVQRRCTTSSASPSSNYWSSSRTRGFHSSLTADNKHFHKFITLTCSLNLPHTSKCVRAFQAVFCG